VRRHLRKFLWTSKSTPLGDAQRLVEQLKVDAASTPAAVPGRLRGR
jgi:hypothetical protein